MKLLRSSTPWLFSLICGIGVVAVVGLGQRADRAKAAPIAANITQLSNVFRDVSKNVLPSVVSLRVKQKAPAGRSREDAEKFFEEHPEIPERFREFFRGGPNGQTPRGPQGMGSGSIIDRSGIILTNKHVVKDAEEVVVRLHDGREFTATDVKGDPRTDVAIVKIEGAGPLQPLQLGDSDSIQVGDWVLAFGSPFGLDLSVTAGIISAKGRGPGITEREDFLQTDAAINPGSSGGPLLNSHGDVIGMSVAIYSKTGQSSGVGFAIPANLINRVVPQLLEHGRVIRPDLGITRVYQTETGLMIAGLKRGGPAERAGLRGPRIVRIRRGPLVLQRMDRAAADLVIAIDGQPVRTFEAVLEHVEKRKPGDRVVLTVVRGGRRIAVPVQLGSDEAEGRQPRSE